MTRRGLMLLTLATSLIANACSGGGDDTDDAAGSTTAAPIVTTAAPSTQATSTTTTTVAPTTTAAPTTTTAPTTEPSATDTAPPTSVDLAQVEQDVMDAVAASWDAFLEAARDPFNPQKLEQMVLTTSGSFLERSTQGVANIAASGVISRPNPEIPATIDFYEDSFTIDLEAGTASVEYCRVGSDLGVELGGNPDGTDKIVVNEHNAYHERVDLLLIDGRWISDSQTAFTKYEGALTCAR